jgi:hypothetical protein
MSPNPLTATQLVPTAPPWSRNSPLPPPVRAAEDLHRLPLIERALSHFAARAVRPARRPAVEAEASAREIGARAASETGRHCSVTWVFRR